VEVEIADDDLATLMEAGNEDAGAGLMKMVRALEQLPADVLARLVDAARAADADHTADDDTDDGDMVS
jgi:hypothetical protein